MREEGREGEEEGESTASGAEKIYLVINISSGHKIVLNALQMTEAMENLHGDFQ